MNLRGHVELTRAAVAAMAARGEGGHIVSISTTLIEHVLAQVPVVLASLAKGGGPRG